MKRWRRIRRVALRHLLRRERSGHLTAPAMTLDEQVALGLVTVSGFVAAKQGELPEGWPAPIGKDAYHGLVGDFVRAVAPHTEGDPSAMVVQTLVLIGNMLGRDVHFRVEDDRHGANLSVAVVGNTAMARKGTSLGRVWKLVSLADPRWGAANEGDGGLSSAEGVVNAVRDANHNGKSHDPGAEDKRFLAMLAELGEMLSKMKREGNTLGATLRNAWDGKTLRIRTRNRPLVATNAHVSVLGHITEKELRALLEATDVYNGFGNRFLWVLAKRSQLLPDSDFRVESLTDLIADLKETVHWADAGGEREIPFDAKARAAWVRLYGELGNESPDDANGHFEALTARAAPQVRRLALIYAAIDRSPVVKVVHLKAAVEVWRYCEQSARYLFGTAGNPLETRVHKWLLSRREWVPRTELTRRYVKGTGGPKSYELRSALEALEVRGLVEVRKVETGGKPRTEYRAVPG